MEKTSASQPSRDDALFFLAMMLAGWAALALAAGVLIYQIFGWLQFGVWPVFTLSDGLYWLSAHRFSPSFEWIGVQAIAAAVLNLPLTASLLVFAFMIGLPIGRLLARYCIALLLLITWIYALLS